MFEKFKAWLGFGPKAEVVETKEVTYHLVVYNKEDSDILFQLTVSEEKLKELGKEKPEEYFFPFLDWYLNGGSPTFCTTSIIDTEWGVYDDERKASEKTGVVIGYKNWYLRSMMGNFQIRKRVKTVRVAKREKTTLTEDCAVQVDPEIVKQ